MLLDVLLILLIIAAFGGFGWNAGWWRRPGDGYSGPGADASNAVPPGTTYPFWNPVNILLIVLVIVLVVVLLSPWPFHHRYW